MVGALSLALTTACADDVVDGGDGLADDGETGGVDPGPDQGLEGIPAEGGIVVTRVEFNQGVGVDVARDGAWLDGPQRIANIVRDRKAIVRAFWDVPADFSPRPIEARLHLRYLDGTQVVKPFTLDVSGPSEPEELATGAFGWILEPAEMAAGMEFRVTLWEQGEGPETTTPVEATEGWSLVGTEDDPAEMKAVLVPVVYMNDQGCSTDMRELTEAQVQGFAQALADQNPTQKVTVTMREEPIFRPNTINDPSISSPRRRGCVSRTTPIPTSTTTPSTTTAAARRVRSARRPATTFRRRRRRLRSRRGGAQGSRRVRRP